MLDIQKPSTNKIILNTNQPIGIFDSGVGGLSLLSNIKKQLPNESLIYIADSLYAPYGDKSDNFIIERVNYITKQLVNKNCKALVLACNTATVIAINQLRERYSIPIIGVEPAIKPAVINSKNKRIAILTTQATAKNQRFLALVDKYKANAQVHIQPCQGLVELIENNQLHSPKFNLLLTGYLNEVLNKSADTIVLGCTHYPFFTDKIKALLGNEITIMETSQPVTDQLKRKLIEYQLLCNKPSSFTDKAQYQFFTTQPIQVNNEQSELISSLLNSPITLHYLL